MSVFSIRLSETEREEWEKVASSDGFTGFSTWICWVVRNYLKGKR